MDKSTAIQIFGSASELARALGITRQAVYQWREHLSQEQVDRVIGAAIRTGHPIPDAAKKGSASRTAA